MDASSSQSSSAKRGGLVADVSSGLIFLRKKKKKKVVSPVRHTNLKGMNLSRRLGGIMVAVPRQTERWWAD